MTVPYMPLSQRSLRNESRRSSGDVESQREGNYIEKQVKLTVPQRQLVGMLIFIWLICLWVGLKFLEGSYSSHHSPLLSSTNALLKTSDLYHTLTLPLLKIANRTKLISTRCGTTTLAPHLLSFLSNDLYDTHQQESGQSTPGLETTSRKPSRYLFAVVVQDSQTVLPDLLSRVLEAIAVLGPDHCHLSVVDHASTDETATMLRHLSHFLDLYNSEDVQSLDDHILGRGSKNRKIGQQAHSKATVEEYENKHRRHRHLSYTITTLAARDSSAENLARIRNMAVEPLIGSDDENSYQVDPTTEVVTDKSTDGEGYGVEKQARSLDKVILLDPVVTCAEDVLELIFQSHLQDADVTCGMDLGFTTHSGDLGHSLTRDMTGEMLHDDAENRDVFSSDLEAQTRFEKRLPFQVESCWSGAVVIRASTLDSTSSSSPQTPFHVSSEQQQQDDQCAPKDDRTLYFQSLWKPLTEPSVSLAHIPRIVVVPSIQFSDSPKDYVGQGRFDGWGLWPKTEKQYRDDLEAKLVAASHQPLYGYRPSTANYDYIPRVEEDEKQMSIFDSVQELLIGKEKETGDEEENEQEKEETQDIGMLMIPEETIPLLKERLKEIRAVFGVQDIQNAVLAKRDVELISEWRDRPDQTWEC
ncbi:cryptococcal mannosyltransferase 1-domain-containing protein [Dissophora ornata]|nr:cryptococcal mannosyltransferase 1-domain-containing protein [Dissophora ornata]